MIPSFDKFQIAGSVPSSEKKISSYLSDLEYLFVGLVNEIQHPGLLEWNKLEVMTSKRTRALQISLKTGTYRQDTQILSGSIQNI